MIKLSDRNTNLLAIILLSFVLIICVFSIRQDSLTMDELAHLPAGYSYLTQKDMRLNPEHPPLIKDLAALPLLFLKNISFPSQIKAWQQDINGQWEFGNYFLFKSGNPADKMIFLSRLPMILVLVILGFYVFKWAKEWGGNRVGLLALFFFCFSPTLLAHGRLVTTDIAAAAGIFIASYYFLKALQSLNKRQALIAGLAFGLAQLLKFTAILLIPLFGFIALVFFVLKLKLVEKKSKFLLDCFLVLLIVFVVGFALVWLVYLYHVWNYPVAKQVEATHFLLASHPIKFLRPLLIRMAQIPVLRAFGQYLLGLFMVFERAAFGHTTYFSGEVSAAGWKIYFPTVYLIKETLAFHLLTLLALLYAAYKIKEPFWKKPFKGGVDWLQGHLAEFLIFCFIGLYWLASLTSDLNIGVRHLIPTFPFVILLVAKGIDIWLKGEHLLIKNKKWPLYLILGLLISWQVYAVISIYPHFLSYFNEIVGGPSKGYIYVVDSNLDWGQDLKRLKQWVDENKIEKIYINYFGGADVNYYFGDQALPWWGERDPEELERPAYLAVSASMFQGGRGLPSPGFNQSSGYYHWLEDYQSIARIGYSIFVYYLK